MSGRTLARIAGSNPAGVMYVSCECCVLRGRGRCVGLITRPEGYYPRVVCVECDHEASIMRALPISGFCSVEKLVLLLTLIL